MVFVDQTDRPCRELAGYPVDCEFFFFFFFLVDKGERRADDNIGSGDQKNNKVTNRGKKKVSTLNVSIKRTMRAGKTRDTKWCVFSSIDQARNNNLRATCLAMQCDAMQCDDR